jgi:hypothetical protein
VLTRTRVSAKIGEPNQLVHRADFFYLWSFFQPVDARDQFYESVLGLALRLLVPGDDRVYKSVVIIS